MASLELINLRLKLAANILDGAASDIRDADYQPRSEKILKIGCALAEIFEIQHRIYVTHPHLMPAYLSKKAMHSEMDKLLTRYMYVALAFEFAGQIEQAIEAHREFMDLDVPGHYKEIAEHEIRRLSQN